MTKSLGEREIARLAWGHGRTEISRVRACNHPPFVTSNESMDMSRVILALAEAEGPASVLGQVVAPLLDHAEVLLVRVWFLEDHDCPVCSNARHSTRAGALHLRVSGGRQTAPTPATGIDGSCHLIRLGDGSRIAALAVGGSPSFAAITGSPEPWGLEPTSPAAGDVRGVLGYPLRFRGRIVGVLACYLHSPPHAGMLDWIPTFAAHAAVAIGQCRALQEIRRLHQELEQERDYLREEAAQVAPVDGIVGESEAIARLLRQVDLVAATDANVLIQGESGTGKELVARAIHQRSPRSGRTLVKVNCASIPRDLFESEFFGHARGAFTGAIRDRVGRFQLADRGTLFLDEVGEIPLELQTKLLRVLQEGDFERVGEDRTRHVDVRVIAATNRDLRAEVDAGRFRLDVFYRLGVFPIHVPPLRERRDDIVALTTEFIRSAGQRLHRGVPRVPQREMAKLLSYDWPGNIRELQHVVERAVILAPSGGSVQFDVMAPGAAPADPHPADRPYCTELEWRRLERENLLAALKASGGQVAGRRGAAALLGLNPHTLASRLRALGLKKAFLEAR